MVAVKYPEEVERSGDKIYAFLGGGFYKEDNRYLVNWSGADPDANMNFLTRSKDDNDWISQGIITMKNYRTSKYLSIMANSACRPSMIRERQRRYSLSMQALTSLIALLGNVLGKEIHKYPSGHTWINTVSI